MRPSAIPPLALVALVYPLVVYLGLTRHGAREVGLVLLALALCAVLLRRWTGGLRELAALLLPLAPLALIVVLAVASGEERLLLALPVLVSLGLCGVFALSLRPGRVSWIGRLARAQRGMDELPSTAEAYCRRVTLLWCAFFLGNAVVAALLASCGAVGWWAAYTGGIAYLLVGVLMGVEWLYRVRRVEPRVRLELADRALAAMATGEESS